MNHRLVILSSLVVFALLLCASVATAEESAPNAPASPQAAVGNAFTYQGRLDQSGSPASGTYDFRFRLYDDGDAGEGTQLGEVEVGDVSVSSGLFSVELDFGSAFDRGTATWLEIGVRTGTSTGSYTTLSPRQAVNASPYALYARSISGSPYENVLVVDKSGGDFDSVQSAIDSIDDASEDNPYLIWIAPGVYEESVTMIPYVHLQGSGQETTVISSTVTNDSTDLPLSRATLILSHHVSLRDLKLVNTGDGAASATLLGLSDASHVEVSDVTIRAEGYSTWPNYAISINGGWYVTFKSVTALSRNGGSNYGLYNRDMGIVELFDCYFTGIGGEHAVGIYNTGNGTILEAKNTDADGFDGNHDSQGLRNNDSAIAILEGGSFAAVGGGGSINSGIYNQNYSSLVAEFITAKSSNGDENYGFHNDDAIAQISHSVFSGDFHAIQAGGPSSNSNFSFSRLSGGAGYYATGTHVCTAMIWDNDFYPETCP